MNSIEIINYLKSLDDTYEAKKFLMQIIKDYAKSVDTEDSSFLSDMYQELEWDIGIPP